MQIRVVTKAILCILCVLFFLYLYDIASFSFRIIVFNNLRQEMTHATQQAQDAAQSGATEVRITYLPSQCNSAVAMGGFDYRRQFLRMDIILPSTAIYLHSNVARLRKLASHFALGYLWRRNRPRRI